SDELMWRYYELLTDLTIPEINALRGQAETGKRNPRELKADLGKQIIRDFHSQQAAEAAENEFVRRFRHKESPEEVEEQSLPANPKGWDLSHLLVTIGLAETKAQARRLIHQGGVYVDGERQTTVNSVTLWKPGMSALFKVGKRHFVRVHFRD
ncbi:MAG: S4 domain-containing protein, partial [Pyrinomonadaceae bacterium]